MPDKISKEKRSKIMGSIRAQSKLENIFSKALWHKGIRFRKNVRKLCGTPDIAIKKYKVVIFVDSCFWHGCPLHYKHPKSNQEFWDAKIARNKERDLEVDAHYTESGWYVLRVWEHDIRKNLDETVDSTLEFIQATMRRYKKSD